MAGHARKSHRVPTRLQSGTRQGKPTRAKHSIAIGNQVNLAPSNTMGANSIYIGSNCGRGTAGPTPGPWDNNIMIDATNGTVGLGGGGGGLSTNGPNRCHITPIRAVNLNSQLDTDWPVLRQNVASV